MAIDTSIIVSTYNAPEWLIKVLHGFNNQTYKQFEIVIADDGSSQETFTAIAQIKKEVDYNIIHVWQEDNGFQKTQILNKALLKCNANYVIMTDGDCIPRADFVEVHVKHREQGYFLSGGYFMLPMDISKQITTEDIYLNRCFNLKWLKAKGLKASFKNSKLCAKGLLAWLLNGVTPTKATWNGHNASAWKSDIFKVNGFDERMQYGGEDRELGERMFNLGIRSKQIRYSAICVHLDHARGYKNNEAIAKNLKIRYITKTENKIWTDFGIVKKA